MEEKQKVNKVKSAFDKEVKRKVHQTRIRNGFKKYQADVKKNIGDEKLTKVPYYKFRKRSRLKKRPEYSDLIKYFQSKENIFSNSQDSFQEGNFMVPEIFSFIDSHTETAAFLKKLFKALISQEFSHIYLDYENCKQIDVGASLCMDVMLSQFIRYDVDCKKGGHTLKIKEISPINFDHYNIKKILFSIGAFESLKGFSIDFPNIKPMPVLVGDGKKANVGVKRERDTTITVDYIKECLADMNKTLTARAESNFYKVIGEVMQNAEEHSENGMRYSVGYFEKNKEENNHYGVFNLAILDFGNTIYETFKNPECKNQEVVSLMKNLSEHYTESNFFKRAECEEESLWTLYALQDGITRIKDWDRGNGSIQMIEKFFMLKGDDKCDDVSKMIITSGNTQIIFNGEYEIVKKIKGENEKPIKMMTFNKSGNIEEKPDPKFVKFGKNYFPGTLISVRIRIDYQNTENIDHE